jgi:predicted secreted protein
MTLILLDDLIHMTKDALRPCQELQGSERNGLPASQGNAATALAVRGSIGIGRRAIRRPTVVNSQSHTPVKSTFNPAFIVPDRLTRQQRSDHS